MLRNISWKFCKLYPSAKLLPLKASPALRGHENLCPVKVVLPQFEQLGDGYAAKRNTLANKVLRVKIFVQLTQTDGGEHAFYPLTAGLSDGTVASGKPAHGKNGDLSEVSLQQQ